MAEDLGVLYRITDYVDRTTKKSTLALNEYTIISIGKKYITIKTKDDRERRMMLGAHRPWAYTTVDAAIESFLERKRRQLEYAKLDLKHTRRILKYLESEEGKAGIKG